MIDQVVIPIAGLGTRLGPLARVVPKALMPLVDGDLRVRPVLHFIITEALEGGCRNVCLVVNPAHRDLVAAYLAAEPAAADRLDVIAAQPKGFGYAVAAARAFTADRPFMLLLGDHVRPPGGANAVAGLVRAFDRAAGAVAAVGVREVGPDELKSMGVVAGRPVEGDVLQCTDFVEKPSLAAARRQLATPGLAHDRFLAHAGLYAFGPELWPCLDEAAARTPPGREIELASAQALLLERFPGRYYLVRTPGPVFDAGSPAGYLEALRAMAPPRAL